MSRLPCFHLRSLKTERPQCDCPASSRLHLPEKSTKTTETEELLIVKVEMKRSHNSVMINSFIHERKESFVVKHDDHIDT